MRGVAADVEDVLYEVFWPVETSLTPDAVYYGTLLGAAEALLSGVTLVLDHYFFARRIAEALEKVGLRGLVGHTVMSWKGPWTGEEELKEAYRFVREWRGRLVRPLLAPHAPDTVDPEWLREMGEYARENNLLIHMHVAQTEREYEDVRARGFRSPVQLLEEVGVLGENLVAAHCLYVDDEDLALLARRGVRVVHCPSAYGLSGSRFRGLEMIERGVRVLLGTDSPCYNDNIDMFEEMRLYVMLQRLQYGRVALSARELLEMATRRAAEALGLNDLGSLEPGKRADLVVLDTKRPFMQPMTNATSYVVYTATRGDVYAVMVDGEFVVWEGRLTRVREEEILKKALSATEDLFERALLKNPFLKVLPRALKVLKAARELD